MNPKSCLIVEDHPQARSWLEQAVLEAFDLRAVASGTFKSALEQIHADEFDIAIVDLNLPDGSGHDLIKALASQRRAANSETKIIVATVMNDDENVFAAMRGGADGYILKEESQKILINMLQGIYEGRPPLSPSIANKLMQFFRFDDSEQSLSPREKEVLQLIAKGLTIARVGELLGISYHTAAGYVKAVYRKLEVTNRAEATVEATRRGLV